MKPAVTPRGAVAAATEQLQDLYPDTNLEDVFLEEILHSERDKEWTVTLGFTRPYTNVGPGGPGGAVSAVLGQARPRMYKRFKIDSESGEFRGMLDGKIDED